MPSTWPLGWAQALGIDLGDLVLDDLPVCIRVSARAQEQRARSSRGAPSFLNQLWMSLESILGVGAASKASASSPLPSASWKDLVEKEFMNIERTSPLVFLKCNTCSLSDQQDPRRTVKLTCLAMKSKKVSDPLT